MSEFLIAVYHYDDTYLMGEVGGLCSSTCTLGTSNLLP